MLAAFVLNSCNVNRDIMFKSKRDFVYDELPKQEDPEYRIVPNDIITVQVFSNDGFILIDMLAMAGDNSQQGQAGGANPMMMGGQQFLTQYFVDVDGFVKLPIVGKIKIAGYTIMEAETFIEKEFSKFYNRPFALVRVSNNRAFVFTGAGSAGAVVRFTNNNTTLIEVLAMSGGLAGRANAKRVKVFRKAENELGREIYQFDLSTIEGIKYADMIVQTNDVIYVEPMPIRARQIAADIAPYVSILSSVTLILAVLGGFN